MKFSWFLVKNLIKDVAKEYFKHWKIATYLAVTIILTLLLYDSSTSNVEGFDTVLGQIFLTYIAINAIAFILAVIIGVIVYFVWTFMEGFRFVKKWYNKHRKEYKDYYKYRD